jgi:endonuclease YncB( thermonuclease family)
MKMLGNFPQHQRVMIAIMFGAVSVYALAAQKDRMKQIASLRLVDPRPKVVDGDTVDVNGSRVRIIGVDAPDEDRPALKAVSMLALKALVARDGGLECARRLYDFTLAKGGGCGSPATSFGRLNLSCRFKANRASVAATMVAQGYAVDYRRYSGGAYVKLMQEAARQRLGLWGQDYTAMRHLAVARARLPGGGCPDQR